MAKFSHPFYGIPYIGTNTTGAGLFGLFSVAVTLSDRFDLALKVWRRRSWPEYRPEALRWISDQGYCVLREFFNEEGYMNVSQPWDNDTPLEGAMGCIFMVYTEPHHVFVGSVRDVYQFLKRGIRPVTHGTGFSEREQRWFGWSHRAMAGFGIGDVVDSENHLCAQSGWLDEYLEEHPEKDKRLPVEFEAKTLDDARRMAEAFNESVS